VFLSQNSSVVVLYSFSLYLVLLVIALGFFLIVYRGLNCGSGWVIFILTILLKNTDEMYIAYKYFNSIIHPIKSVHFCSQGVAYGIDCSRTEIHTGQIF